MCLNDSLRQQMKNLFYILFLLVIFSEAVKSEDKFTVKENKGLLIVEGLISQHDWLDVSGWDSCKINNYCASESICKSISRKFEDKSYRLLVVAGSWCGDTKTELPKLFKIINVCKLDTNQYDIIGVDTDKMIKVQYSYKFFINKVPSLIVLKDGTEIGIIDVYPELIWDEDIMIIL